MITAADTEFHPRDPTDRIWTEKTYLAFSVPEAALHGTLYVLTRPSLGVAMSLVIIIAREITRRLHEVDFCDPQTHLHCPPSYASFTLENGLCVEAGSLRDWTFLYQHKLGACRFELDFKGLRHPYDPIDPAENPLFQSAGDIAADPRMGDAWSHGHFDLKDRITGRPMLRGEAHDIDCHEGVDRSSGPRNETPARRADSARASERPWQSNEYVEFVLERLDLPYADEVFDLKSHVAMARELRGLIQPYHPAMAAGLSRLLKQAEDVLAHLEPDICGLKLTTVALTATAAEAARAATPPGPARQRDTAHAVLNASKRRIAFERSGYLPLGLDPEPANVRDLREVMACSSRIRQTRVGMGGRHAESASPKPCTAGLKTRRQLTLDN